jgi:ABC-2 type transport system ATP-binding protein
LTKDYAIGFWRKRPYRALDRLTLDVEAGEVFGFLGPNGAGKTTTLKLLMQLVFPTSGRAEMLGRPLGDLSVKRRLGYLPENPYLRLPHRRRTAALLAALFGYPRAECRARANRPPDEVDRRRAPAAAQVFERDAPARRHRQALINDPSS